jgi:NTE family protein
MKTALVLSGGGARGAYEVGVIRYLRHELPARLGFMPRFDILCGTSVGAINAAFLAAYADDPVGQARRLGDKWRSLRVDAVFDLSIAETMRAVRLLLGGAPPAPRPGQLHRGGVLNPIGLERIVMRAAPWSRIASHLDAGHLEALSVSATHVGTGKTVVFVERRGGGLPPWSRDPFVRANAGRITPFHILASAALPVLFPAVSIDGTFYSDGGLRQNTPLSPALRLGADRVLVISLRHVASRREEEEFSRESIEAYPSPWFLFGKSLNALLLDHTDYDLDRLRRLNAVIDGGVRAFGPRFVEELNRALVPLRGQGVRRVHPLLIRPSEDIGRIAGEHARSPRLRGLPGLAGRAVRYLGGGAGREADLLSYLLFDGEFAEDLMQLGLRDARAHEDQFLRFFDDQECARAMNAS